MHTTPDESNAFFEAWLARRPVMVILRGFAESEAVRLAMKAWEAGVSLVEVPLQGAEDARTIAALAAHADSQRLVGAGTIISSDVAEAAAASGASFTVSPGYDRSVAQRSLELGMPHLAGVATASEVQAAMGFGLSWLKGFPANALGPAWFSGMAGPFPGARLVATGGVSVANGEEFLSAGAAAVSLGASFAEASSSDLVRLVRR